MEAQARNVDFLNTRTIAEQANAWGAKKVYPVTSNKDGVAKTFEDGTPKMFLTDGLNNHTVAISKNICMMIASKAKLPNVVISDVVDKTTGAVVPTLHELKTNSNFAHEDYAMEF